MTSHTRTRELLEAFRRDHDLATQQSPISGFFNYYSQYRTFQYDDINTRFEKLAEYSTWSQRVRARHRRYLDEAIVAHITPFDKLLEAIPESPLSYFRVFVYEYGFVIDPTQIMDTFQKLRKIMRWDPETKQHELEQFQTLVEQYVGSFDLDKLSCMQHIILRYLPHTAETHMDTKSKCRKILEINIFVNIYDFATVGNHKCFLSLEELGEYTRGKKKWYPKAQAKDKPIFKLLLKKLRFWMKK